MINITYSGVVAGQAEPRTAAVCVDAAGDSRLVVAARGWVLVVDPTTGDCRQLRFSGGPEFPFSSLASRSGTFWTGAGRSLYEVDPFAGTVTTHHPCERYEDVAGAGADAAADEEIVGMGFTEGPDGRIWFTTYPGTRLFSVDPATGHCRLEARLSTTEQYASHLAVTDDGRLYAGIGTEHRDLVVLDHPGAAPRSLVPPAERVKGAGYVHRGADGELYGLWDSEHLHPLPDVAHRWHRLTPDGPIPVEVDQVSPSATRGYGFGRIHAPRDPGWSVARLDLPGRELTVAAADGATRVIPLSYESDGAKLSALIGAPDGSIVGTTSHPMRFFRFDPAAEQLTDLDRGGLAGVGNVCDWALLDDQLYGAAYPGGHFFRYDPQAPTAADNPAHLVAYEQVHRPRCVVAHPDQQHVIWGGYGGYGDTGGGLAIHQVDQHADGSATGRNRVIEHTDLVPHQATTALGMLHGGDVIGATCVDTPGGATPLATTAVVYRLAWPGLEVVARWEPDAGVGHWAGLAVAPDDTVHLWSEDGHHVHLDPADGTVLARHDLTGDGRLARAGVVADQAGTDRVAVLQERAITVLDLTDHTTERHPWPGDPISSGGVFRGDTLHLASQDRLLRAELSGPAARPGTVRAARPV
ncbi:hypothetical protein ACQBAU_06530 [Propionibacteriaceae bacterium Y2011]|uniref:hypothetical protein n=1 Tax=Microlunatus sp. Y2014 TaxID=3418488 RepID=UPI003B4BFF89